MDYLDCKGLSEAAEIHTIARIRVASLGCRLEGADLRRALFELMRRRSDILAAYERCAAVYVASLPTYRPERAASAPHDAPVRAAF